MQSTLYFDFSCVHDILGCQLLYSLGIPCSSVEDGAQIQVRVIHPEKVIRVTLKEENDYVQYSTCYVRVY